MNTLSLSKKHIQIRRQYLLGRIDIVKAARRLGYKGSSLQKGYQRVKTILKDMKIIVL